VTRSLHLGAGCSPARGSTVAHSVPQRKKQRHTWLSPSPYAQHRSHANQGAVQGRSGGSGRAAGRAAEDGTEHSLPVLDALTRGSTSATRRWVRPVSVLMPCAMPGSSACTCAAASATGASITDNGAVERAIREPAIGRKNYLFTGFEAPAHRLADAYPLVQSCRVLGLPTRDYLIDVFQKIEAARPARPGRAHAAPLGRPATVARGPARRTIARARGTARMYGTRPWSGLKVDTAHSQKACSAKGSDLRP
jgi:hypothetical protein